MDQKTLDRLLPAAAAAAQASVYRKELGRSAEHVLLGEWHRQLAAGGADAVLDSLRPTFNRAAKAIAEARSLINVESTAEQIIASGKPELVTAWQQLDGHIQVVARIGRVAAQFGSQPAAQFPQVVEYSLADGARITDQALICCDGPNLAVDSHPFQRPDSGHRTSPWFRVPLRLHSIESATQRYNAWAAEEFDEIHSGPRGGWIDENGRVHTDPAPVNPYRQQKVST